MSKMKSGASALGAKTARPCDSCLLRRARWFCAADDAFLCHGCYSLVHSANQLAGRHVRVRQKTASSSYNKVNDALLTPKASWHSGFTRKAGTPRHNNKHLLLHQRPKDKEGLIFNNMIDFSALPVVPELGSEVALLDTDDSDETEEQILCRVPVFDPFNAEAELCDMCNEVKKNYVADEKEEGFELEIFSDVDLAEFAADVESLLLENSNNNLLEVDEEAMKVSNELFDCKEEIDAYVEAKDESVKVKDEELEIDHTTSCHLESIPDETEAYNWYVIDSVLSPEACEEEEKMVVESGNDGKMGTKKNMFLRLNYEEVINAWARQGSPWTTVYPPHFNSHEDCWPHYLGSEVVDVQWSNYGEVRSLRGDGEREARVSRYREKRRTRLFSKKIRYEVRKLNAEKRPRLKGRFVKRASLAGATAFPAQ